MARATGLTIPFLIVTGYYIVGFTLAAALITWFPGIQEYLPIGALDAGFAVDDDTFQEVIFSSGTSLAAANMWTLCMAIIASVLLMIPVSWIYILTHGHREVQASMVITIMSLPIVVAGIAVIVQNSIPLAFSLAGIVAAVQFRFSLSRPSHALFIFCAIGVGLAAGIRALEVAIVLSICFVYAMMFLWKLDYGEHLDGRLISLLVGRSGKE